MHGRIWGFLCLIVCPVLVEANAPERYFNNWRGYSPYPAKTHLSQQPKSPPSWHGAGPVGRLKQVPPVGLRQDIQSNLYQRTSPLVGFNNGNVYYISETGVLARSGFISNSDPTPWYSPYANSVYFVAGPTVGQERSQPLSDYWEQRRKHLLKATPSHLPAQYQRHPVRNQ